MKPEYLEEIIAEWAIRTGQGFKERDVAILIDMLSEATEAELDDLRDELSPVNDDWEE